MPARKFKAVLAISQEETNRHQHKYNTTKEIHADAEPRSVTKKDKTARRK
jgi:hypothetical protein